MRTLLAIVVLLLAGIYANAQRAAPDDAKRLVGTWRLVSELDGERPVPARGPKPRGLMVLDGKGHLTVQIMPDRERPVWPEGTQPTG